MHTDSSKLTSGSMPFISSPSMVDRFLDECEADREYDSPLLIAVQPKHCEMVATAKRPKPITRRVALLQ